MPQSKKTYGVYFLASLLPAAMFFLPSFGPRLILHETVLEVLPLIPYLGFALAGILGWRLNQTRILLTALLFLGTCYVMVHPALFLALKIGKLEMNQILCIGIPIMLAVTFIAKESQAFRLRSLFRVLLLLTPLVLLTGWFLFSPDSFRKMAGRDFFPLGSFLIIPQMSFFSISILGFIAVLSTDDKIKPFILATVITLIPFLSAAQVGMSSGVEEGLMATHTLAAFSIASFIHLHAIFRMYWQRVYIDELTQIPNRRALDEHLQTLSGNYMVAMMDIDHFKKFNDTYGHDEGDNVLRMVGKSLSNDMGNAFRYGGEEFFAVFEGRDCNNAFSVADQARKKLAGREFFIRLPQKARKTTSEKQRGKVKSKMKRVRVTVSIGLARSGGADQTPAAVMKSADEALYKAKGQGRNCVVVNGE
ncbi:MAG: GGDEF domain-containing protein [Nitrospinae bacterium]|nr:GGDEF domain-containing protein [Nitrospinota bacterium]